MAKPLRIEDFENYTSIEQVEDEYTRMELIALSYWMRYEILTNDDSPDKIADEYLRRMRVIYANHEDRLQALAKRGARNDSTRTA